ncbi:hypothetical protein PS723_02531 [Pseudomonas fluorescens]|uniref:Uncharacterized protein n=1 Tax=Pseudomonas fluorescens TaxID=294 RepID=A0A5E7C6D3_PSEFL|nr:hypothetical protein PS723_02531 [Pseudomonas fluorescens]
MRPTDPTLMLPDTPLSSERRPEQVRSHMDMGWMTECKKPLNREIQGLGFNRIPDQAAWILLRFCMTLFR